MMQQYLVSSPMIDFNDLAVLAQAQELAAASSNQLDLVKRCFEFVRDKIEHSWDYHGVRPDAPVTCKASDVLKYRTGFCYAKSHLLAALLRANHVPTALCYQRLPVGNMGAPYCLHGLNAVYLEAFGWYRMDARGNKANVNAQFNPPHEMLAFAINEPNAGDFPGIYDAPLDIVIQSLNSHTSIQSLIKDLPDMALSLDI